MEQFPLLWLPRLAIDEVLREMNPFEIINFSLISRRTKQIVKYFSKIKRNVKRFVIELAIHEDPIISMRGYPTNYNYVFTNKKLPNGRAHRIKDDAYEPAETIVKQCKDKLKDWKNWLKYMKEVLNFRIHIASYYFEPFGDRNKEIIDFLRSFGEPIGSFEITCCDQELSDEYTKYAFDNLQIENFISLDANNNSTLQTRIPNVSESLFIRNAQWLSLAQLLTFETPDIKLMYSSLTPLDLNFLLWCWTQSESNLRLENFEVYIDSIQSMEIIMNLPHEIGDINEITTIKIGHQYVQFRGGLDIKRNDGKRAKVFLRWHAPNLIFMFHALQHL